MSDKESVQKFRHKKRLPCFSSCFSSSIIEEPDVSESTSFSRDKASRFSWFSFKKRKMVRIDVNISMKPTLPYQREREKSREAKRSRVTNKSQPTTRLPKISSKYQSRSQQVRPQTLITNTVRTGTRTELCGSIEPNRLLAPESLYRFSKPDPLIALSMLGITLALIVIFGRVYAIVCSCICFYLMPLLKTTMIAEDEKNTQKKNSSLKLDLESKEYKKRAVLQGLLERNDRRN